MVKERKSGYCSICGTALVSTMHEKEGTYEVRCPRCGAAVHGKYKLGSEGRLKFEVPDEYKRLKDGFALVDKTDRKSTHKRSNPWVSGLFYLIVFIVVIAALSVVAKMLPVIALLVVLLGGILALSTIGAFQLRQDDKLGQKNFLELMALTFKYLPWLKKGRGDNDKSR